VRTQIADFVAALVGVYTLIIFASIIVSWIFSFGVRVPYSRPLNAVLDFLRDVTNPYLRLFRRLGLQFGPIDFSPIVASAPLAELDDLYPNATAIFRVLPNLPVALRKGVLLFAQSDEPEAETVKALFARVGTVVEIPETLMRVGNSITGVGPAYWALLAEAWTDAAVRHGMPAAQAATLVRETMAGTAALLNTTDTLALRRSVTSPGGSTARGLNALEQGGVRAALANAADAVVGV
jgi:uncharacterized protein YggT (Ycf19 family)